MKCWKYPLILIGILFVASCRTSRRVQQKTDSSIEQQVVSARVDMDKIVKKNQSLILNKGCVTSKINLVLGAGDKSLSVGGNLRMKRNDVIQLSLVAFGILEAGRLELTQDYILILDRMGRKYIRIPYSDLEILTEAGVDFYTFQSLFWGEIFVLDANGTQPKDNRFDKTEQSGMVRLQNSESKHLALTFLLDAANQLLQHTTVSVPTKTELPLLDWQYLSYTTIDKKQFPSKMQIAFKLSKTPVLATMTLNKLKTDDGWETRTEINTRRYKEVTLSEVLSQVMNLSK